MKESTALDLERRQALVEETRINVYAKTGGRCGLATMNSGQCSGHRTEVHHIIYRSHGGGDEIENLLPLCSKHHAQLHERGKPLMKDEKGRRYYQLPADDGIQFWYLWEDVEQEFVSREARIYEKLLMAYEGITAYRYGAAVLCAEVDAMHLYALKGYDSAADYIVGELGESYSAAKNALRVGHWLRVNPHLLQKIQTEGLYFSAIRGALPALQKMRGDAVEGAVDMMIAGQADGVPVESIVESVREAAGIASELPEWEITVKLEGTGHSLTRQLFARTSQGAWKAFERLTGLSGDLEGIVTVADKTIRRVE